MSIVEDIDSIHDLTLSDQRTVETLKISFGDLHGMFSVDLTKKICNSISKCLNIH